jgi:hypothetical protein
MEDTAMVLFFAGVLAALAPSTVVLAWIVWAGGIGEDPDQKTFGRVVRQKAAQIEETPNGPIVFDA